MLKTNLAPLSWHSKNRSAEHGAWALLRACLGPAAAPPAPEGSTEQTTAKAGHPHGVTASELVVFGP